MPKWSISAQIMCLTDRARLRGSRTAKHTHRLTYTDRRNLAGELAVAQTLEKYFIVRIAWVFGLNGKNFIKTMLQVGKNHPQVHVVNDQIGTPTYTYDLADCLLN